MVEVLVAMTHFWLMTFWHDISVYDNVVMTYLVDDLVGMAY